MIIRKIKPEEIKRTDELFSIAFEYPSDNEKSAMELYEDMLNDPSSRHNKYWMERYAAFEDDDKTMMSYFSARPLPVHYDGNHCQMTGIGGVATLPQYRRRGGIRGCFEKALKDMYENGYEFSYLYPFSTVYYRKFGYELCCEKLNYKLKLAFLPVYPINGSCELAEPSDTHLADVREIHRVWQNTYNMMVENEDCDYLWLTRTNPVKEQEFTYIYKDVNKTPKGYLTFKNENTAEGRVMQCSRFVYTDLEGFKGLINLVKSFSSDHMFFVFSLPVDQYIAPLLPEWSMGAADCKLFQCGMARVVHVEKVLKKSRYLGSGEIRIAVTDPYIEENNQTFHVCFNNGTAYSVSKNNDTADITLNISDFSRLIIGCLHTEQITFLENVIVNTDLDTLRKVFYKKPVMITEYF